MPGMSSVSGLISGLKTDDIITKMMDIARQPQQSIKAKKTADQQKLAAWQDINTRVLALKMKCDNISLQSTFKAKTASSSDNNVVTVSASDSAMAGSYFLKVTSRAQNHQLSSQIYSATDADIGTGKVKISLGTDNTNSFEVTIDSKNNTLSGLKDAINNSKDNKGVQAVIISTGTSAEPKYQLLLTSTNSGTQNAMTVTTSDWAGGTAPVINTEVQAAKDATVVIGEGAGQITVTKSTNTIKDLIPGVTLNVGAPDENKTIKIDVAKDTKTISASINSFVTQYNDLIGAIDKQFEFDSQSGESGTLFGDYQLQSIQSDLFSMVNSIVPGASSKFNTLSAAGITLDTSGKLNIDDAKLTSALNTNTDDVVRLFSAGIQSDSSYVTYIASSGDTKSSGANGWNVDVTQAATRSQATAGVAFANGTADGKLTADETLTINSIKINLTAGMTLTDAIKEINSHTIETNVTAMATAADGTGTGGFLTLRNTQYGSKYDFSAISSVSNGTAGSSGLGTTSVSAKTPAGEGRDLNPGHGSVGLDVIGTINGEAATGSGQILTAKPTNTNSPINGLTLMITSTGPMSSKVIYSKGIGTSLRDMLVGMTSAKGIFKTVQDTLNKEMADFDNTIADMEAEITMKSDQLYNQFNKMESQLSELQSQGNYFASMIGGSTSSSSK